MKKMTPTQLKQYVIAEAKKLARAEVLKEEKVKILGQLKMLNENDLRGNKQFRIGDKVEVFIETGGLGGEPGDYQSGTIISGQIEKSKWDEISKNTIKVPGYRVKLDIPSRVRVMGSWEDLEEFDVESSKIYPVEKLNENEGGEWTTATISAAELGDFIDYLDGWNLQYHAPVDLGNGQFSIRHEMETDDVMNQMNHQDAEERLSNMDDKSNYSELDEERPISARYGNDPTPEQSAIIDKFVKDFSDKKDKEKKSNIKPNTKTSENYIDENGMQNSEEPVFDSARNARTSAAHNAWQFAGKIFQDLDDETRFSREALINIADGMKAGIDNYLQSLLNSYPEGQLKENEETKMYKFKVKHDNGSKVVKTSGSSVEVAKKKIASAEGCPESAITLVS